MVAFPCWRSAIPAGRPQERRSPGWGREDPSRTLGLILTLRRGAHRAGGGKIRLGPWV